MQAKHAPKKAILDRPTHYHVEPVTPQWRVLIADDDPYIRQMLELALSEDGYGVMSAIDGHELVRLAQDHPPSLILVDLAMPRMDGYEAIRQLRNDTRTAHVPMLILTARTGAKDVVTGFETGADDFIAKPFDITELLARVKSHLRRSAQRPVLNPLTGLPGGVLL
jgi:DNA-binding response OmpR family regulator